MEKYAAAYIKWRQIKSRDITLIHVLQTLIHVLQNELGHTCTASRQNLPTEPISLQDLNLLDIEPGNSNLEKGKQLNP